MEALSSDPMVCRTSPSATNTATLHTADIRGSIGVRGHLGASLALTGLAAPAVASFQELPRVLQDEPMEWRGALASLTEEFLGGLAGETGGGRDNRKLGRKLRQLGVGIRVLRSKKVVDAEGRISHIEALREPKDLVVTGI